MARLKAGTRMRSAVCNTEVMIIQAPDAELELRCGGAALIEHGSDPPPGGSVAADAAGGTALGKRYVDEAGDLEVLCTKPGEGSLSLGDTPLTLKGAKPLPSSD